ncbi:MAG: hypothetical protein A3I66_09925 [Burkholderiales bacterium RIFCSPLOWO2_02_FULL_57_36]|nr:MAG: hypothetical protein A3I66_09925 [Burkholderiales bacterium RIFCSPLOWO2_02_FULL_57_36]
MRGRKFAGVLVALSMLVMQTGCAAIFHSSYSSEPIEATVVDADTGEPLEGVIVVAHWELVHGSFGGRVPSGQLKVMEAVTDKAGIFRFPAWGPVENKTSGSLEEKSPQILIFKSGYEFGGFTNKLERDYSTMSSRRRSEWHGKTMRLKKFKGSQQEYARHLSSLTISLRFAYSPKDCEWKYVPQILVALDQEEKRLSAQKIVNGLLEIDDVGQQNQCGSARKFFEGYLK